MCALDVARDGILGKGLGPQAQRTGSSSIESLKACGPGSVTADPAGRERVVEAEKGGEQSLASITLRSIMNDGGLAARAFRS